MAPSDVFMLVSKDIIARWIRTMLNLSGVSTARYTVGSVQLAAASKAMAIALVVDHIRAKAGWSKQTTSVLD